MHGGAFKRLKRKAPVARDRPRPRATRVDTTYVSNDQGGLSVYQQAVDYEEPITRAPKRPRQDHPVEEEIVDAVSSEAQWEDVPMDPPAATPKPSRGQEKKRARKEAAKTARVSVWSACG